MEKEGRQLASDGGSSMHTLRWYISLGDRVKRESGMLCSTREMVRHESRNKPQFDNENESRRSQQQHQAKIYLQRTDMKEEKSLNLN